VPAEEEELMSNRLAFSLLVGALGMGSFVSDAAAAGFEAKTMRDPLSVREVERGLIIGRGWLEFGFNSSVKQADGYWNADGEAVDFESAEWLYSTHSLDIRYGISRRAELRWRQPVHYMRLGNELLGTDTSQVSLGDPSFGYSLELLRSAEPLTSWVVYTDYTGPGGTESPGSYLGGPMNVSHFVVSTGTPAIDVGTAVKTQMGPLALQAGVGFTNRFSAVVQYAIEITEYQFGGRVKPGNIVHMDGGAMLQAGPVALGGSVLFQAREATKVGTTAGTLTGNKNLVAIDGSDGWSLDANVGAVANLTRGVDITAAYSIPLRGEDLQFFPLEAIHPTRGNTVSVGLELRY